MNTVWIKHEHDEATFQDDGYMSWETPVVFYPGLHTSSFGLDGNLMQPTRAETEGFLMDKHNNTVEISIPYDAAEAHRKSVVSGDLYEIFFYDFYMEQLSVDEDGVETRLRIHKAMATPLLMLTLQDENRTVLEEDYFTIHLGEIPQDVGLVLLELNGQKFQLPLINNGTFSLVNVVHSNNTHGYTLKVPFYNSSVIQQFHLGNIEFMLDINYTLMVSPEQELYFHSASFIATLPDLTPPQFDASCSETSVHFKLHHNKPISSKWEMTMGSEPLTPRLAARRGFVMSNNSQALTLDIPLTSDAYERKNFSLRGFLGTFEMSVRDVETSAVQSLTVKTCPFFTEEFLDCSTDMTMTAVVTLSLAVSGGAPADSRLREEGCRSREADAHKALFMFTMNKCGSTVKLGKGTVTYENEILHRGPSGAADRVLLQCTYPLSSLHRILSDVTFASDTPGAGRIARASRTPSGTNSTKYM